MPVPAQRAMRWTLVGWLLALLTTLGIAASPAAGSVVLGAVTAVLAAGFILAVLRLLLISTPQTTLHQPAPDRVLSRARTRYRVWFAAQGLGWAALLLSLSAASYVVWGTRLSWLVVHTGLSTAALISAGSLLAPASRALGVLWLTTGFPRTGFWWSDLSILFSLRARLDAGLQVRAVGERFSQIVIILDRKRAQQDVRGMSLDLRPACGLWTRTVSETWARAQKLLVIVLMGAILALPALLLLEPLLNQLAMTAQPSSAQNRPEPHPSSTIDPTLTATPTPTPTPGATQTPAGSDSTESSGGEQSGESSQNSSGSGQSQSGDTGQSGNNGQTGSDQSGSGQTGDGQSGGQSQSGDSGQSGDGQSGDGQSGNNGQTGSDQSGDGQSGDGQSGSGGSQTGDGSQSGQTGQAPNGSQAGNSGSQSSPGSESPASGGQSGSSGTQGSSGSSPSSTGSQTSATGQSNDGSQDAANGQSGTSGDPSAQAGSSGTSGSGQPGVDGQPPTSGPSSSGAQSAGGSNSSSGGSDPPGSSTSAASGQPGSSGPAQPGQTTSDPGGGPTGQPTPGGTGQQGASVGGASQAGATPGGPDSGSGVGPPSPSVSGPGGNPTPATPNAVGQPGSSSGVGLTSVPSVVASGSQGQTGGGQGQPTTATAVQATIANAGGSSSAAQGSGAGAGGTTEPGGSSITGSYEGVVVTQSPNPAIQLPMTTTRRVVIDLPPLEGAATPSDGGRAAPTPLAGTPFQALGSAPTVNGGMVTQAPATSTHSRQPFIPNWIWQLLLSFNPAS